MGKIERLLCSTTSHSTRFCCKAKNNSTGLSEIHILAHPFFNTPPRLCSFPLFQRMNSQKKKTHSSPPKKILPIKTLLFILLKGKTFKLSYQKKKKTQHYNSTLHESSFSRYEILS